MIAREPAYFILTNFESMMLEWFQWDLLWTVGTLFLRNRVTGYQLATACINALRWKWKFHYCSSPQVSPRLTILKYPFIFVSQGGGSRMRRVGARGQKRGIRSQKLWKPWIKKAWARGTPKWWGRETIIIIRVCKKKDEVSSKRTAGTQGNKCYNLTPTLWDAE